MKDDALGENSKDDKIWSSSEPLERRVRVLKKNCVLLLILRCLLESQIDIANNSVYDSAAQVRQVWMHTSRGQKDINIFKTISLTNNRH